MIRGTKGWRKRKILAFRSPDQSVPYGAFLNETFTRRHGSETEFERERFHSFF